LRRTRPGTLSGLRGRAQALSKRIHYGKFVAEAKFLARPGEYAPLIRRGDHEGLMALLTDQRVEALVRRTRSSSPANPCGRLRSACWCTLCQRAMWGMRLVQEPV